MHGPIPMKLESCRAEMVRVCLSPAQILRQGSMQAIIVGLRTFGRRTHEDEWDEVGTAIVCAVKIECFVSGRLGHSWTNTALEMLMQAFRWRREGQEKEQRLCTHWHTWP